MAMTKDDELVTLLTKSDDMTSEEEKGALERILGSSPDLSLQLCRLYFDKSRKLKVFIEELKIREHELKDAFGKLTEPPWYLCTFLRYSARHMKALIRADRRMAVSVHPDIEDEVKALKTGSEVYLNNEMNCVIATEVPAIQTGIVGIFQRYHKERGVLKGVSDREIVVDLSCEISEVKLRPGDSVIFDPETRIAYEKIEKGGCEEYFVEDTPVSFEEIGGLDDVIDDLLSEIELHFFHRDLTVRHNLPMAKGVLLSGPPGCGKTLLAKCIANHLARLSKKGRSKFMNIKPGSQRSMWYGQTEANVREIFHAAMEAAKEEDLPVIIFFDEIDNLGARSGDVINGIDSRVLTAFLAEIDGLDEMGNIFLIGATNRADLLDDALLRPGRFGDRVFQIPRPKREAAVDIFRKYLTPDLPYAMNGRPVSGSERAEDIIESAVSHIYSPNGDGNLIATLIKRDGKRVPVYAPELMSGALIANIAREAKKRSCVRGAGGMDEGITLGDVLDAIDKEMEAIRIRMKKVRGLHTILTDLPDDIDVVRVEVPARGQNPAGHEYLRMDRN